MRAFAEVMRNLHRMKMCIKPSMCKPYGKQSEMLQKSMCCFKSYLNCVVVDKAYLIFFIVSFVALEDTLLLVQAMRSFLPPPQY